MSGTRRAYEVERVPEHTITEQVAQFEDSGEKKPNGKKIMSYMGFVTQKRVVKNGFMVYFPRGHFIFVENEDALKRLKLHEDGGLIDMATGERVDPDAQPRSLKDQALQGMQRARTVSAGGVEGNIKALE